MTCGWLGSTSCACSSRSPRDNPIRTPASIVTTSRESKDCLRGLLNLQANMLSNSDPVAASLGRQLNGVDDLTNNL